LHSPERDISTHHDGLVAGALPLWTCRVRIRSAQLLQRKVGAIWRGIAAKYDAQRARQVSQNRNKIFGEERSAEFGEEILRPMERSGGRRETTTMPNECAGRVVVLPRGAAHGRVLALLASLRYSVAGQVLFTWVGSNAQQKIGGSRQCAKYSLTIHALKT